MSGDAHADRYRAALLDWLACAVAGSREPAVAAARAAGPGLLERVAAAGTAGHVLDFDDTYVPGLAHLSAPVAPAALIPAAELGANLDAAVAAYAAGFEATAALARAGHPALYDGGWHPTAVCGGVGAAVAAARLLELDEERARAAQALAALRAGGLRAGFGSHGKSLQVGMAAATGVHAARAAAGGAAVALERVTAGPAGYEEAFGARWAEPVAEEPAVNENWIKAYPCCLETHGPIEAAAALREHGAANGAVTVVVHPRARQAATFDDVESGLEAKFSIPYVVAYTLLHGPPGLDAFETVDGAARERAASVRVREDGTLAESEAAIEADGAELSRVRLASGSPQRPLTPEQRAGKLRSLAGARLDGVLDDLSRPATDLTQLLSGPFE